METFAHYTYTEPQRLAFHSGPLRQQWESNYPQLFDADDIRIAATQARLRAHFFEWLAAVRLYDQHRMLSLLEKYHDPSHTRKHDIFTALAPDSLLRFFEKPRLYGMRQPPDLFVRTADDSDWFMCEVKGNRDKLRPTQLAFFHALEQATGKPVRLILVSQESAAGVYSATGA